MAFVSGVIDSGIVILVILRLYFTLDLKANEVTHRIWEVERNGTISDTILHKNALSKENGI